MSLKLYFAPRSSASPVMFALAELGIEHEIVEIDLSGDAHKQPDFLKLNPMGQVPTLVDGGQAMFESSACIVYLGETYGVERGLWPEVGSAGHMRALTWVAWAAVALGTTIRQCFASGEHAPEEMRNPAMFAAGKKRYGELIDILDAELAGRQYLTGDDFTLADCYPAAAIVWASGVLGVDLGARANVAAWVARVMSRPAAGTMG